MNQRTVDGFAAALWFLLFAELTFVTNLCRDYPRASGDALISPSSPENKRSLKNRI